MAVSAYSARVITAFSVNRRFWFFVSLYLFTIVFSLVVFIEISSINENGSIYLLLKILVLISYSLGLISIISLIPYILTIFDLMKPESMICQLKGAINLENLNSSINDPILPIVDIISSSIEKNDSVTIEMGLNAIITQINKIIEYNFSNIEEILILSLKHLNGIDEYAMNKQNVKVKVEVAKSMTSIGNTILRNHVGDIENLIRILITSIGNTALEDKLEDERFSIFTYITILAKQTAEIKFDSATSIAINYIYKSIFMVMDGQKMYPLEMVSLESSLVDIIKIAIDFELEYSTIISIKCIGIIGKKSSERNWDRLLTTKSIDYLEQIVNCLISKRYSLTSTMEIVDSLEYIGNEIYSNEVDPLAKYSSLKKINESLDKLKKFTERS